MEQVAEFFKVSQGIFLKDYKKTFSEKIDDEQIIKIYNEINLPQRATKFSAGYDFFSPIDFSLIPNEEILIPTGIRVKMNDDIVLLMFPRSSLGFKYRLQLNNTIGVIDKDYFYTDNEGHIFVKITNDTKENKVLTIKKNIAFCQGIFTKYYITFNDNIENIRSGGLGSTNEKNI